MEHKSHVYRQTSDCLLPLEVHLPLQLNFTSLFRQSAVCNKHLQHLLSDKPTQDGPAFSALSLAVDKTLHAGAFSISLAEKQASKQQDRGISNQNIAPAQESTLRRRLLTDRSKA
jgi:formiminotetrahydrofolate cyclodeaminase